MGPLTRKMIRRKKNVKKGIQFCLMVCGASGTGMQSMSRLAVCSPRKRFKADRRLPSIVGRTTFVNTLCGKTVLSHKDSDDPSSAHVEDGVKIKPITVGMLKSAPREAVVGRLSCAEKTKGN